MAKTDIGRAVPLLKGEYNPATTYELNDIVSLNGSLYWHYSHEETTNVAPQATSTWKVVLSLADAEAYIARAETAAGEAEDAKDAALAAQTAAETASTTATGASATATAAKNDAVTAKTAAETAQAGAVSAKNDAVTAKEAAQTAASSAGTSATNANNSAGTAQYYAESAGTSASTATTKAGEASASASIASTAATTATTKANEASASATTATTKAGEASTSATSAASSAAAAQAVKDSIPEDYSALSEDVGDLKTHFEQEINDFVYAVGVTPLTIYQGKYFDLSGATVDPTQMGTGTVYNACCYSECKPGDIFTIHGTGGATQVKLWAFVDQNNNILATAQPNATLLGGEVIAPANSKWFISNNLNNSRPDYYVLKGRKLTKTVNDNMTETNRQFSTVNNILNDINKDLQSVIVFDDLYMNTDTNTWQSGGNTGCVLIPVKPNDLVEIKAPVINSSSYAVLKDAMQIVGHIATYATGYDHIVSLVANSTVNITIPSDGYFLSLSTYGFPESIKINGITYTSIYTSDSVKQRLYHLEQDVTEIEEAISGGLTGEGGTVLISSTSDLFAIQSVKPNVAVLKANETFVLDDVCIIPDNTFIIGNGATIKRADGYDGLLIRLGSHCTIDGLIINGNRENTVSPTWSTTTEIRMAGGNSEVRNTKIIDGNEAIVIYGDDCIIFGCYLSNCGGNGIHFSGAQRSRVENTVVIGANKKSGMGHEDGCIIWSNACQNQVCINCWCEDGISGFGSIDSIDNSDIKLIGNTVKDCTSAVDAVYTSLQPSNLIITDNEFVNSGSVLIRRVGTAEEGGTDPALINVIISNNVLKKTNIDCEYIVRLKITDNIVDLGFIAAIKCPYCIISGNIIDSDDDKGISIENSYGANVSNNSVLANLNAIFAGSAPHSQIIGNTLRVRILGTNYPNSPAVYTSGAKPITIIGNSILSLYGLYLYGETICKGNIVKCKLSGETAIGSASAFTGIIKDNIVYGNLNATQGETAFVGDNLTGVAPTMYTVTMQLTNITSVNGDSVWAQDSLLVTLTPAEGYTLPETITITMGGRTLPLITEGDYTNIPDSYTYDSNTGIVRVHSATGNIVITAVGIAD